jgi:hypothetical protein
MAEGAISAAGVPMTGAYRDLPIPETDDTIHACTRPPNWVSIRQVAPLRKSALNLSKALRRPLAAGSIAPTTKRVSDILFFFYDSPNG